MHTVNENKYIERKVAVIKFIAPISEYIHFGEGEQNFNISFALNLVINRLGFNISPMFHLPYYVYNIYRRYGIIGNESKHLN